MRTAIAALFLLSALAPAHAAELGTLFHTPDERKALDAMRANASRPQKPAAEKPAPAPAPERLDGFVVRTHGPATVWINGRPVRR